MAGKGTDRRVQKTRRLLQDALITLIAEKGFDAVTIQELLDKANVGRSTFYLHFDNKEELLHSCFEEFNQRLDQHYAELLSTARQETDDSFLIAGFFQFAYNNHAFFKSLMGEHGLDMFVKGIQGFVSVYLERMVKKMDKHQSLNSVRTELLTHYVTNAFVGVLKWWVVSDMPCPAEELGRYVLQQAEVNIDKAIGR